jgi:hypothetical protein
VDEPTRELEEVIRWLGGQDHQEARALLSEERRVQGWALRRLGTRELHRTSVL